MSMTHDEMIAVIAHHRDGGKVEYQNSGDQWCDCGSPSFDFARVNYRIKPDPRSLWEVRTTGGNHDSVWINKLDAKLRASLFAGYTVTEYKEVLP